MVGLGRVKTVAVVALVLAGGIGSAVAFGVVGAPAVESVDNRFITVSEDTTTIQTALTVTNPNPVGVQFGSSTVDYDVSMNSVSIASGTKEGIGVERGNSTLTFTTTMQNDQIPAWWFTHIENRETTQLTIDATASSSLLGGQSVSLTQNRTIETDIIGQFNSDETRPVNASQPVISDPVLYINETRGSWDRDNLNESTTPIDIEFDVYNPKTIIPYTVSKIGYTTSMNNVTVGDGESESNYVILPGETETVDVSTVIENENLDEWWVSHLERNQETDLYIDFYLILEANGKQFQIDLDAIDYETVIETDIFGNKAEYPTGSGGQANSTDGDGTSDDTTDDGTETDSETETDDGTETETDDDILNGTVESPL